MITTESNILLLKIISKFENMNDTILYNKLSVLPQELKSEVSEFIDALLKKAKDSSEQKKPIFGSGKGIFVMHKDFDEPIEDFKDYIQ